jgi:hypothetical protein
LLLAKAVCGLRRALLEKELEEWELILINQARFHDAIYDGRAKWRPRPTSVAANIMKAR